MEDQKFPENFIVIKKIVVGNTILFPGYHMKKFYGYTGYGVVRGDNKEAYTSPQIKQPFIGLTLQEAREAMALD